MDSATLDLKNQFYLLATLMVTQYLFTEAAHAALSCLIGRRITFRPIEAVDLFYADGHIPNGVYACAMEGCTPSTFYLTAAGTPVRGAAPAEFFAVEATIHEFIINSSSE